MPDYKKIFSLKTGRKRSRTMIEKIESRNKRTSCLYPKFGNIA